MGFSPGNLNPIDHCARSNSCPKKCKYRDLEERVASLCPWLCRTAEVLFIFPNAAAFCFERLHVTLSAAKLGARVGAIHEKVHPGKICLCINRRKDRRNLLTGAGRRSPKRATSSTSADPEIVEEWKWAKAKSPGTPVFSHGGIVCTGETYKTVVKLTFAKGASLKDPSRLFNSSLDGNVRRAIDIHEGEKINEAALKDLIRAAVALNLKGQLKSKTKPKPRRASSKRAG